MSASALVLGWITLKMQDSDGGDGGEEGLSGEYWRVEMWSHLALYPPGESLILSNLATPDYLVITGQTEI